MALGYPLESLYLGILMHMAPRILRASTCYSEEIETHGRRTARIRARTAACLAAGSYGARNTETFMNYIAQDDFTESMSLAINRLCGGALRSGMAHIARTLTSVNAKPIAAVMTRTVSASGIDWGVLAAAGVLTILPGMLVIWFVRNHVAKGFALGRV